MTAPARLAFSSAFLVVALTAGSARASVAVAASFDEKVDNAAAIVVGKCVKTESRFDPSGRWIVTYSTFDVEQSMKGDAGRTITVVTPGGSVNGIHQSSIGVPSFREGSENVLFIRITKLGPTVLYFDQGAYEVQRDDRGQALVAPVASDLVHIDTQRGVAVPAEVPRTLQDFTTSVDRLLRTAAERHQKMSMINAAKSQPRGLMRSVWEDNKLLLTAALIGLALAAWQAWRR